jgi:bifunctional DNase/RNase
MVPIQVQGLAVVDADAAPVLLLREKGGRHRWLVITVGAPEAKELASARKKATTARPGTIELIGQVIEAFGRRVVRVELTGLHYGIFHADLVFDGGLRLSARPSDALAIALRQGIPVEAAEAVLDEAAVELEVSGSDPLPGQEDSPEQQVEEFRTMLDDLTPDDFRDPELP